MLEKVSRVIRAYKRRLIKKLKKRSPVQRFKSRQYYKKHKGILRAQRRRYFKKIRPYVKPITRKLFKRTKPKWMAKKRPKTPKPVYKIHRKPLVKKFHAPKRIHKAKKP